MKLSNEWLKSVLSALSSVGKCAGQRLLGIKPPLPPIQRLFRDIPDDRPLDEDQISVWSAMGISGAFGWEELLKSKRALIVSEAGVGKTFECQLQRDILWASGEPAFYVELAELSRRGLREMLTQSEIARLDTWRSTQSEIATFFLDSVDELKLTLGSFEQALVQLRKAIDGQLGRTRVVITTRPIPVDEKLFRQLLPVPDKLESETAPAKGGESFADVVMHVGRNSSKPEQEKVWRNVVLLPLAEEQIVEMARQQGVNNPSALLSDIRRRHAEEFAKRPQDLIELCADWRNHEAIRTHRKQVANNIVVKLKARTSRKEGTPLSPDKAFEGASRLALAAMLTRKLTFRHSAEADKSGGVGTALDPADILTDWSPGERSALLERALFGFASYGRVRFHHRSVIEYLASERLNTLLNSRKSLKAIKRLLFTESAQREKIVRPSMQPVAAWLALHNDRIFEEVRDRDPDVLFNFGDPESLRPQQRVEALNAFVAKFGKGGWRGIRVPSIQVHRFAAPDLASELQRHWTAGIENPEVRELLLSLIGEGKIRACSDIAVAAALQSSCSFSERFEAVDALAQMSDGRLTDIIQSIEGDPALWPDELLQSVAMRLFPVHITPAQLCPLLGRLTKTRTTDVLRWQLPQAISDEALSIQVIDDLRAQLSGLIKSGMQWRNEWPHIVSSRSELVPALAAACLRLWKAGLVTGDLATSTVLSTRVSERESGSKKPVEELRSYLSESVSSTAREMLYWADDALCAGLKPSLTRWERFYETNVHGPVLLNYSKDISWVRAGLSDTRRSAADRGVMLEAAMRLWEGRDYKSHILELKRYVQDSAEFLAVLDERLQPPRESLEIRRMNEEHERIVKKGKREQAKARDSWVKFWKKVSSDPDKAFDLERVDNTAWNLWQAMERSGDEDKESGWNRRFIERHFDSAVADKLRRALSAVWRRDRPTLRSERSAEERNSYLLRWRLGLAAIQAEAEDPLWADKLSTEDALLAARYAPIQLNGFPAWLDALAKAHPSAISSVLGGELVSELSEVAGPQWHSSILQGIRAASPIVVSRFKPQLQKWLNDTKGCWRDDESELIAIRRATNVIDTLLKGGDLTTVESIRQLSVEQVGAGSSKQQRRLWIPILMRLDPALGTDAIEKLLADAPISKDGEGVGWFAELFGDRFSGNVINPSNPQFTPTLLLRLLRLAYRHVRRSDDITHNSSYTPHTRDHAQGGREAILKALLDSKGTEGWSAKIEVANDPAFTHFRDRAIAIARARSAEEADNEAHSVEDVRTIDRLREAPPLDMAAMFVLLCDRLDDIDELLLTDVSPRAAWAGIQDETVMRRVIAHELRNASNNVYTVDQEAATADEKETDIRLRSSSSHQQAVIELKIGEKRRSVQALRQALKDQLVKKYMATHDCRSGCFLITDASGFQWTHPDNGAKLNLGELVSFLNADAVKITSDLGGEIRLIVRGLNLRPHLTVERGEKAG